MREQLVTLLAASGCGETSITEIDVDSDALLESRWGDKVPVLLLEDRELCHYTLDRDAVRRALVRAAATGSQ